MLCAIAQLRETQVGWCGGGIYSAVLILTVPEQSEQTGWCVFYHFAKEVAVGGFFWGVLF